MTENELKRCRLKEYKFDISDCPVTPARPCSKCTHQSALLAKAVEALEKVESGDYFYIESRVIAREALAEINKGD